MDYRNQTLGMHQFDLTAVKLRNDYDVIIKTSELKLIDFVPFRNPSNFSSPKIV